MSSIVQFAVLGVALAVSLTVSVRVLVWLTERQTLTDAERIARLLSTDAGRLQRNAELRDKLLRYKLSKVRASFGAPAALGDAAANLVSAYRFSLLESG